MDIKTIVLTGASDGIGKELAIQLARKERQKLVLAARDEAKLKIVVELCRKNGADVIAVVADVSKPSDCKELIEKAIHHFGKIDILVNNAGIDMSARFDEVQDLSLFEQLIRTNYLGAVYCTYFALPSLKATQGLIVTVSSLQGKLAFPLHTGYAASKFALQGFFDSLRMELHDSGVDVLVISPGGVATDIHARAFGGDGKIKGHHLIQAQGLMPIEKCARLMIEAIQRRDRETVMTFLNKFLIGLKLFAPNLADRILIKSIKQFNKKLQIQ